VRTIGFAYPNEPNMVLTIGGVEASMSYTAIGDLITILYAVDAAELSSSLKTGADLMEFLKTAQEECRAIMQLGL
jgi:hypothetical protein